MGGFVIGTDDPGTEAYIPNSPRITLTPNGILFLARTDHLPDISVESIKDKSKADHLAKTLVCLQAGWIIVQYVGRLASHLPVTLLEINTVGHVVCALLMYTLWWSKPLDVLDPTLVTGEWVRPLCALMCMNSDIGRVNTLGKRQKNSLVPFEMDSLNYLNDASTGVEDPVLNPNSNKSHASWSAIRDFAIHPQDHSKNHSINEIIGGTHQFWEHPTSHNISSTRDQPHISNAHVHPRLGLRYQVCTVQSQEFQMKRDILDLRNISYLQNHLEQMKSTPLEQRPMKQMMFLGNLEHTVGQIQITSKRMYEAVYSLADQVNRVKFPPNSKQLDAQKRSVSAMISKLNRIDLLPETTSAQSTVAVIRERQVLGKTGFGLDPECDAFRPKYNAAQDLIEIPALAIHLDAEGVTRWTLASEAMKSNLGLVSKIGTARTAARNTMVSKISNWPHFTGNMQVIVLSFVGALYGGLHASAWNGYFPSGIECVVWKAFACFIAGSGGLFAVYMIIVMFSEFKDIEFLSKIEAFFIVYYVGMVFYIAARVFLIIEAFISLRDLPVKAYSTPSWTQFYTPFIGCLDLFQVHSQEGVIITTDTCSLVEWFLCKRTPNHHTLVTLPQDFQAELLKNYGGRRQRLNF